MEMDSTYLDRIRAGDVNAFRFLVKKYQNLAFAVAFGILQNEEDAEEVVQDAFLKACTHLNTFDGQSKFSTWLYKIVYRKALNARRKLKNRFIQTDETFSEYEVASSVEHVFDALKTTEQRKYINLIMKALPEEYSLVLTLFYLAENTIDEIKEITDWQTSNVKIKLYRGRKLFYAELSKLLKEEIRTII